MDAPQQTQNRNERPGFKNIDVNSSNQFGSSGNMPEQEMQQFRESIKRHEEAKTLTRLLADVAAELRILEDRYTNLRKKNQLTDQALLETQRTFSKEKRVLNEELAEAKMKLQDLTEDVTLMKSEFKDVVKQKDFKVIEKYLDMWEPLQFVTRKEVDELIDELEERKKELVEPVVKQEKLKKIETPEKKEPGKYKKSKSVSKKSSKRKS
ncbi:hypothetical protein COV13_02125 [Candidatus Woesearchaeota archaeon CG10_big_fil_rev_8_21_14_0_10_32_9]|nr:MAG: hypothetical protein COV13_02125 [Candidatus Woesearchaeota archaeon CG10_big_fil_rev_8_21_14_0_10_32_9]